MSSDRSAKLLGRAALVFGAGASGPGWSNGKAAAVALARAGARVACVDIVERAAQATVNAILGEGGEAIALVADVTDNASVAAAVATARQTFGAIDILHNNVGHAAMGGPVELSQSDWQRELDVNLSGVFLACKHVLPIMLDQGKGAIVNISSAAGLRYTGYDYASYYAAKGGVNQLTVGLALQYAKQGIRINAICPGIMDTPLVQSQIRTADQTAEEVIAARHAASPTGRMGSAWDVANAAVFLARDDAAYITAVCLPVDGGLTARAYG